MALCNAERQSGKLSTLESGDHSGLYAELLRRGLEVYHTIVANVTVEGKQCVQG